MWSTLQVCRSLAYDERRGALLLLLAVSYKVPLPTSWGICVLSYPNLSCDLVLSSLNTILRLRAQTRGYSAYTTTRLSHELDLGNVSEIGGWSM